MPRVEFDHAEFETAFAVYADDPDEARRIMPPGFLDTLLAIAETEGGKKGARAMRAGSRTTHSISRSNATRISSRSAASPDPCTTSRRTCTACSRIWP